jgi:putative endonuclease
LSFLRRQESRPKEIVRKYFVYMLASKRNGTLYLGMTSNLLKRVYEHKNNLIERFSKRYNVHTLVYYEVYNNVYDAIAREKSIKKWKRSWKIGLLEKSNPEWKDLYHDLSG